MRKNKKMNESSGRKEGRVSDLDVKISPGANVQGKSLRHFPRAPRTCHPNVFMKTFGCQMNQRDSGAIVGMFVDRGYSLVDTPQEAGVIIINTCSVRGHAEDRAFSIAGTYQELPNKPIIGIVGCMAQSYKQKIFKRVPYVNFIAGPSEISRIPDIVDSIRNKEKNIAALSLAKMRPEKTYSSRFLRDKKHAYVNISQGCDNYCAYCIVPFVRGGLRHRKPENILKEIRKLVSLGIKDVTLLGQNVNSYCSVGGKSKETKKTGFAELLRMVNDIEGLKSFSFVTSHPKDVSTGLFRMMRDLGKLKKYLHLPIQSGSDRILKLMNRGYSAKHYKDLVRKYREIIPGAVLATDVIVGFPGESEKDFRATYNALKEVRFNSAFIFKYSPRPGTEAAKMKDDILPELKSKRHTMLLDMQRSISRGLKKYLLVLALTSCLSLSFLHLSYADSLKRAQELFLNSDYQGVIAKCKSALPNSGRVKKAKLKYLLGQAYIKTGDLSAAEDVFTGLVKKSKTSSLRNKALLGLGDVYFLKGDYKKAKEIYLRAGESQSDLGAGIYYRLAQTDFKLGNLSRGKKYIQILTAKFPSSFEAKKASLMDTKGIFYTVQVGAFSNKNNALQLIADLKENGFDAYVESVTHLGDKLYRVRVGRFESKDKAVALRDRLSDAGYLTKIFP